MLGSFQPLSPGSIESRAFSIVFRCIAVALGGGSVIWFVFLGSSGKLDGMGNFSLVLLALFMMAIFVWAILRSVTRVNPTGLEQTWIWTKRLPYAEIVYAKLFRIRGLEMLIAPRLYVRSTDFKIMTFYAIDAAVLDEFLRIENELRKINGLPLRER